MQERKPALTSGQKTVDTLTERIKDSPLSAPTSSEFSARVNFMKNFGCTPLVFATVYLDTVLSAVAGTRVSTPIRDLLTNYIWRLEAFAHPIAKVTALVINKGMENPVDIRHSPEYATLKEAVLSFCEAD